MKALLIAITLFLAAVVIYTIKYPTYVYRYRLTIDVEIDGVPRSASSVIEVRESRQPQLLPEMAVLSQSARGEAIVLDLSGGRKLVAILSSIGDSDDYPTDVIRITFNVNGMDNRALKHLSELQGKKSVPSKQWPTLLVMTDPRDSTTIQVLEPSELSKSLPGARWIGATVEMTTDPVTYTGIEQRLPFVAGLKRLNIKVPNHPGYYLQYGYFIRGK